MNKAENKFSKYFRLALEKVMLAFAIS